LVYHGPPKLLNHYFTVEHPEDVYLRLTQREAHEWHESWQKKRSYYEEMLLEKKDVPDAEPKKELLRETDGGGPGGEDTDGEKPHPMASEELPGLFSQVFTLLSRRWTIFRRDKGQVWLHLAMLIGFPL